jgi:ketosteroid isomerase-like protein
MPREPSLIPIGSNILVAGVGSQQEENLAVVRALWAGFRSGGVEQLIQLVGDEVEWQPLGGEGAVLRGAEQLRDYFSRMSSAGEALDAIPRSYRAVGDLVLVSGTLRVRGPEGLDERTAHWIYRFKDGRLASAKGCASLADCERVLADEASQSGS